MDRYFYREDRAGGVTIFDRLDDTGTREPLSVYLQPGDDASRFLADIGNTNTVWTDQHVMDEYFTS